MKHIVVILLAALVFWFAFACAQAVRGELPDYDYQPVYQYAQELGTADPNAAGIATLYPCCDVFDFRIGSVIYKKIVQQIASGRPVMAQMRGSDRWTIIYDCRWVGELLKVKAIHYGHLWFWSSSVARVATWGLRDLGKTEVAVPFMRITTEELSGAWLRFTLKQMRVQVHDPNEALVYEATKELPPAWIGYDAACCVDFQLPNGHTGRVYFEVVRFNLRHYAEVTRK